MSKKKRRLSQSQIVQLTQWMNTNRSRIVSNGLKAIDVAALATTELEFEISDSSVKDVAETLAVKLRGTRGLKGRKSKVRIVARELVQLLERLGEPVPDDLFDVSEGR